MSETETPEKVIQELSGLAKRKPLKGNDSDRATELCMRLRGMGYSYTKISELTGRAWSGTTIRHRISDRGNIELEDLLKRVKASKMTFEELQQAFAFKSELDGLGMTPSAICEAVNVSKAYNRPKELMRALKALKELEAQGLDEEALEELSRMSERYGGVKGALESLKGDARLKEIQDEIEALSSNWTMLAASTEELSDQIQKLGSRSEEVNKSIIGLFDPMRKELEDSTHQLREEVTASIADISAKYEEYSNKMAELSLRAGALEEELRIARFVKAIVNYPSEIKDLPLDYDLLMLKGVAQHCQAREVNPRVKIDRNYGYISELEFKELLEMAIVGLSRSLSQSF